MPALPLSDHGLRRSFSVVAALAASTRRRRQLVVDLAFGLTEPVFVFAMPPILWAALAGAIVGLSVAYLRMFVEGRRP